jgi:two-component system nitrogen regulation sensor histidine kinase NtrY
MTSVDQAASLEMAMASLPAGRVALRVLGPIAVAVALLSALATFLVLNNLTPIVPTHNAVVSLLAVNAATVVVLLAIIALEGWFIFQARRRGRAAARLHVRIVALFSVIAAVPAILVAIVASVTLDRGLDQLFSRQISSVIENSRLVAEAYVREHAYIIRVDLVGMAFDVARAKPMFDQDRERFKQFFNTQTSARGFATAMILGSDLSVVEQSERKIDQEFIMPTREGLAVVTDSAPQLALFPDTNYVVGIIKLRNFDDRYLYVVKFLDPRVVAQLRATQESVAAYSNLDARRFGIQVAYALMYTAISLIVLLSAVWIGLNFANYLVAPIRRLIGAAQVVSTGNLYVQVPIRRSEGDLAHLGETFNKMTHELRTQRDDIVNARDLIDSRRRFTEAVLAGASAGVIGVDAGGRVSIMNRSAEKLIERTEADTLGQPLEEIVPELAEILENARSGVQRLVQGQVTINRKGRERNLSVRVTTEQSGEADHGYVVTLDDITELVIAQRTAAWGDVARRIAHEIKNPLTPIQLSAERLRRKYGGVIVEDRAVFEQCTQTIIRQVDDIKRMVDEFSKFARMPKPVLVAEDVADTVRQVVFLMRVGHADIDIDVDIKEDPMPGRFDRRLISQGLTNIIKNAAEAIAAVPASEQRRGNIKVSAARDGGDIVIDVADNGIGLPKENRNRLLEPYFTTRDKGTGLGLAIVGRILEEHGGRIELGDAADIIPGMQGAWMRLRFEAEHVAVETAAPERRLVASER